MRVSPGPISCSMSQAWAPPARAVGRAGAMSAGRVLRHRATRILSFLSRRFSNRMTPEADRRRVSRATEIPTPAAVSAVHRRCRAGRRPASAGRCRGLNGPRRGRPARRRLSVRSGRRHRRVGRRARAGSADEPLDASARLTGRLAAPLEEADCRPPVEAVGGAKRLQVLVAEAEGQLEALGRRQRADGVGVARAEGRGNRLGNRPHGASIPAGRWPGRL